MNVQNLDSQIASSGPLTIGRMMDNIQASLVDINTLLHVGAFVVGGLMFAIAYAELRAHAVVDKQGKTDGSYGKAIAYMISGSLMMFLGLAASVVGRTMFGNG